MVVTRDGVLRCADEVGRIVCFYSFIPFILQLLCLFLSSSFLLLLPFFFPFPSASFSSLSSSCDCNCSNRCWNDEIPIRLCLFVFVLLALLIFLRLPFLSLLFFLQANGMVMTFDLHDCRVLSAEDETGKPNTFCVVNFSDKAVKLLFPPCYFPPIFLRLSSISLSPANLLSGCEL